MASPEVRQAGGPRMLRVVVFALLVAVVPWLVGGGAAAATRWRQGFPLTGGAFVGIGAERWVQFADDWFLGSSVALPVVVAVLIVVWLWATPLSSRWTVAGLDAGIYAVVTVLLAFGNGFVAADRSPLEYALVALVLAVVTLQLPLCFLLSAWTARPMGVLLQAPPPPAWRS